MRAYVLYEFPMTFVAKGSRAPKTERFTNVIEIDIPEIEEFPAPVALRVEFGPDPMEERFRTRCRDGGYLPYLDIRSDEISLAGYAGALWRNCQSHNRHQFHRLFSNRLRGAPVQWGRGDPYFMGQMALWASPDGMRAPPMGFLKWMDSGKVEESLQSDPLVIRFDAKPEMPGGKRLTDLAIKELIDDGREATLKEVREFVSSHFLLQNGSLYERVNPPALQVRRFHGGSWERFIRSIGEDHRDSRGSAWFAVNELDEFNVLSERLKGRRGRFYREDTTPFTVTAYEPAYAGFDRTDEVIKSLQAGIEQFAVDTFATLPDETMLAWMAMRRTLRSWTQVEGNPVEIFEALDAFDKSLPASAAAVHDRLRVLTAAAREQRPMLDMAPRAKPSTDEDLNQLGI